MRIEKISKTNLQFGNRESSPRNGGNSGRKNKDEFEKNFKAYIIEPKDKENYEECGKTMHTNTPQQLYEQMANKSAIEAIEILQQKRQLEEVRRQRKWNDLEK